MNSNNILTQKLKFLIAADCHLIEIIEKSLKLCIKYYFKISISSLEKHGITQIVIKCKHLF